MNELKVDFEKKLENLIVLHDLYLERMLKTSDPLQQDTLLIVVDSYKEEMKTINEVIHRFQGNTGQFIVRSFLRQISVYKNN